MDESARRSEDPSRARTGVYPHIGRNPTLHGQIRAREAHDAANAHTSGMLVTFNNSGLPPQTSNPGMEEVSVASMRRSGRRYIDADIAALRRSPSPRETER